MEQKKDTLHQKNMEYILHTLKYEELLCQMAEEWVRRLTGGMEDGNNVQQDSEELLGN